MIFATGKLDDQENYENMGTFCRHLQATQSPKESV